LRARTSHDHAAQYHAAPRHQGRARQGANVTLQPGEKIGLIGRNGAGKSSLFSLLTGRLHADAGDVDMPPRWRIGEVAQDMPDTEDGATDFVLQGDLPLMAAQAELAAAEASGDGNAMAHAHLALDEAGAFDARARAQALLLGLGFKTTSSMRRSTASAAAGACGCSWRAH
jgi:ATP-binding cassette subfamily F protein 3